MKKGRPYIYKVLPHICIVIFGMFTVFYFIDFVNPVMNFIYNNLTKGLLILLCVVGIICAVLILEENRRMSRRSKKPHKPAKRTKKSEVCF